MHRKLFVGFLCLLSWVYYPLQSQQPFAAVLRVEHSGVEIQREDTLDWLPLVQGALAPIGTGDKVRTDSSGRAALSFLEAADVLILPQTTYRLEKFEAQGDTDKLSVEIALEGHFIQRTLSPAAFVQYRIKGTFAHLTQPANLFGVWSTADHTVIIVAEGEARVATDDGDIVLGDKEGVRGSSTSVSTLTLEQRLTAPHLVGILDGCPGVIQTSDMNLNVRVGPGSNTTVIGNIPNHALVQVMAQSESRNWLRIQFLSGFGWISNTLVSHDCGELLILPNTSVENNIGLFNVSELELQFLVPFYGAFEQDLWFYRTLKEPAE